MAYHQVAAPSSAVGRIRPFGEGDIQQVAELHRSVFATARAMSAGLRRSYETYFREVFLSHPFHEPRITSLVYEENGRVAGFSGASPVRMLFRGKPVLAKVLSQFVVNPRQRGFTGVKILQAAFNGPQDLTIADESNSDSRTVWEAIGGSTAWLHSFRWIYPLRPCALALSMLAEKRRCRTIARVALPFVRPLDWLAAGTVRNSLPDPLLRLDGQGLDSETLLNLVNVHCEQALHPSHDQSSLAWALRRASALQNFGELQQVVVKSRNGSTAGWFLYYSNPGGIAEVLQMSAKGGTTHEVFDLLIRHAGSRGAAAVRGRLDPIFMESYVKRKCPVQCGPWVMVHSMNPELTRAFQSGDVFFSRLEGEWVLRFR